MAKTPITALIMLMLVMLSMVGIGHGLWSEELDIQGVVETGSLDVDWSFVGCFDIEDKDVGAIAGFIEPGDSSILSFQIVNGYPGYLADCEVEYTYSGSVPARVEAIRFVPGDFTGCVVDQSATVGSFVATCDEVTVTWANNLCANLVEGDFLGSSLRVEVEQGAAQNATYGFGVEVQVNQFNSSACP